MELEIGKRERERERERESFIYYFYILSFSLSLSFSLPPFLYRFDFQTLDRNAKWESCEVIVKAETSGEVYGKSHFYALVQSQRPY